MHRMRLRGEGQILSLCRIEITSQNEKIAAQGEELEELLEMVLKMQEPQVAATNALPVETGHGSSVC